VLAWRAISEGLEPAEHCGKWVGDDLSQSARCRDIAIAPAAPMHGYWREREVALAKDSFTAFGARDWDDAVPN
jgi:hypothetical protein